MSVKLSLHLRYFALLREQRGLDHETVTTTALTPRDLYLELATTYPFSIPLTSIGVAINNSFVSLDQPLASGDTVTFLPPVAGG